MKKSRIGFEKKFAIVLPIAIFILLLGMFFSSGHTVKAANLISNPSFESGTEGDPTDWGKGQWGENTAVFTYPTEGFDENPGASVELTSHTSGDVKWYFTKIPAEGGAQYEFTNAYKSNVESFITAAYHLADGTIEYTDLALLPASSDWSQTAESFTTPENTVSLTIFHLINDVGILSVDAYSLENIGSAPPPPPPPPPPDPSNLISNPSFESGTEGDPTDWGKGRWGENSAVFTYPVAGFEGVGASVELTSHTSGDAKWYFKEVSAEGGTQYKFTNAYKSNVESFVTAAYRLSNGTIAYTDLALLPASPQWQETNISFTTPENIVSLTIFHLINRQGSLTVDAYTLQKTGEPSPPPPPQSQGMVSLTFDDGWKSIYENGFPLLEAADIESTQYIITGRFEFPAYMTKEQVLEMRDAGHEIGSHTVTHRNLITIPQNEARQEIEDSRGDLLAIGVSSVNTIAYPFGGYNGSVKTLVRDAGYTSARSSDDGFNIPGNIDFYAIKRQPITNATTFENMKGWIDEALREDLWLILAFHRIDDDNTTYSTPPQVLQQVLEYLNSKDARVVTIGEAVSLLTK